MIQLEPRWRAADYIKAWLRTGVFDPPAARDQVYRDVFVLRKRYMLPVVDEILETLNVDEFADVVLIALLNITSACAGSLVHRRAFYARVAAKVKDPTQLYGLQCATDGEDGDDHE